jgi:hypothetical protein
MMNAALRDSLIRQAEAGFLSLTGEIDHLFDRCSVYLTSYPENTRSVAIRVVELKRVVGDIANLTSQLGEVIKRWKHGEERVLSVEGTELSILNEIWVNVQALLYFLTTHKVVLEPFSGTVASSAFQLLLRSNRLLP